MKIANAKTLPRIYFGLHMTEGVAEYREPNAEPYRIFIGENTIKNMDATFQGRPVYVQHVDDVNLDNIQTEADGYVVRSFFNKLDGKHWAEFIVVSDKGHEAIRKGWKLSNAYIPHGPFGKDGLWHGVQYAKEVLGGEYEHLAIVPNPRYEESVIMTPDEFKVYNGEKELELTRIANSNNDETQTGEKTMKLNFFKKAKVENTKDLNIEEMSVTLPKSKIDLTIAECVEQLDAVKNMNGYANGDHMVKVGEDEMSVNDLVKKHMDICNQIAEDKKQNEEDADDESMDNAEDDKDADDEEKKKNEEDEKKAKADEKKQNAADAKQKEIDDKKKKKENFEKLKNAPETVHEDVIKIELSEDQVARGKSRYGSAS